MPSVRVHVAAAAIAGLTLALGATIASAPAPRLVWNVSDSAPRGLYLVRRGAVIARGNFVLAWAPAPARELAARRGYLPRNVPLIKRVAALPGERVCAIGNGIFVSGRRVTVRRMADRQGRALPAWHGCRTLGRGERLLLMPHADSFDGRYFGPSAPGAVIGQAMPLWVG
jgi:conjugative transfer signal peptidase TraF